MRKGAHLFPSSQEGVQYSLEGDGYIHVYAINLDLSFSLFPRSMTSPHEKWVTALLYLTEG